MSGKKSPQQKDMNLGGFIAMALNFRLLTGEALEIGDEVDPLVFVPILIVRLSMLTRMTPAELTSVTIPMKWTEEFVLGKGVLIHRGWEPS